VVYLKVCRLREGGGGEGGIIREKLRQAVEQYELRQADGRKAANRFHLSETFPLHGQGKGGSEGRDGKEFRGL